MSEPVKSPEGLFVTEPRRNSKDVSPLDVGIAAGHEAAIRGDWWQMTDREAEAHLQNAVGIAKGLGVDLPEIGPGVLQPGANPAGEFAAIDLQNDAEDRYNFALRKALIAAREKNPTAFEGMPVTDAEILDRVTGDLRAEYDDLQVTLGQAPDTFSGNTLPRFVAGVAVTGTDHVNLPLTIGTLGLGAELSLARTIALEAGINIVGEAASLPDQFRIAERLDIERPNAAEQIAFAGIFGAAFPVGVRAVGAGARGLASGARIANRELVSRLRKSASELNDVQRGAVNKIEARIAEEDVGPAARGADQPQAIDQAIETIEAGGTPDLDTVPAASAARVGALTTPRAVEPPEPAPPAPAAVLSLEASLGGLIRDAEARGAYDTVSDFSLVLPDRPITDMSLDEIDALQTANIEAGAQSTAIGGYQVLRGTLREIRAELGLTGAEKFTPALQDRIGLALMERRGLNEFKAGTLSAEEFADSLAGEWAGLPLSNGLSKYAGDGLNAATMPREAVMAVLGGQQYDSAGRPPPRMSRIPSSGVQVDPKTYQFRSDVNTSGVTSPLSRATEWDELLAGDFIIHERFDGGRFIADGHHRADLARRLEAEGRPPIDFNAFVLREADGYSVAHVRAIAAVKNIEAGNATAVDAAKVLRIDPAMLEKLTLRNSQARDARGLMNLSDEGFDMVTNGIVPESYAAFVGTLTRDTEMQDGLLNTLARTRPRNLAEARQIAQDAQRAGLAAREKDDQGSLFGDDFGAQETLFKERARVLSTALNQLRQDSRIFKTLVAEERRIAQAGNALDTATNQQRAATDETALALIEKLVNRAGPLDDALNNAARRIRSGASVAGGVRDFVGTVRDAIEGGGLRRLLSGEDGSAKHVATPDGRADGGERADARQDGEGVEAGTERLELDPPSPAAARVALGDAFDDPSTTSPAVTAQMEAAENELRAALERGEEIDLPTGRIIDDKSEVITAKDLFDDMDADADFLGALDACKR